jgi:hypothetical protein
MQGLVADRHSHSNEPTIATLRVTIGNLFAVRTRELPAALEKLRVQIMELS